MGPMKPEFIIEGHEFFNEETEQWELKPNAPEWAKKEFKEFYKSINPEPDENGIVYQS